jgi:hypothetical protein
MRRHEWQLHLVNLGKVIVADHELWLALRAGDLARLSAGSAQ